MKTAAKILVCYNSPVSIFPVYNGKPLEAEDEPPQRNDLSESGFSKEITRIKKLLLENFTEVSSHAVNGNLQRTILRLNSYQPDIIFNFVESVEGISEYESCMAGLFELLNYPFTGNPPAALGNCLNKALAKTILSSFGINTPAAVTAKPGEKITEQSFKLNYPVILKLLNEDASIGISEYSVVKDFNGLQKQLSFLFSSFNKEVLIEEFIDGRELNVAVLGGRVLPASEILFDGLPDEMPKIVTYDGKWMEGTLYYEHTKPCCPANLDASIKEKIEDTALRAFNAMGCRDYARVDIRLSRNNVPYVIEVNPNPDISLDSGFARAASAAGISYSNLLATIARLALKRKEQYDTKNKAG